LLLNGILLKAHFLDQFFLQYFNRYAPNNGKPLYKYGKTELIKSMFHFISVLKLPSSLNRFWP